MKKIIILTLSIFAVFLFPSCSNQESVDNISNQQPIIESNKKTYYDNFRKKCEKIEESQSCCLSSVDNAEKVNSLVYDKDNPICPDGSTPITNKCPGSFKWCPK